MAIFIHPLFKFKLFHGKVSLNLHRSPLLSHQSSDNPAAKYFESHAPSPVSPTTPKGKKKDLFETLVKIWPFHLSCPQLVLRPKFLELFHFVGYSFNIQFLALFSPLRPLVPTLPASNGFRSLGIISLLNSLPLHPSHPSFSRFSSSSSPFSRSVHFTLSFYC